MAEVYMAGDFRNGTTFEMDGNVFKVVEFQHVKPGKGQAFVRTKLRNLRTGTTTEYSFNAGEKLEQAMIEKRKMQYLYGGSEYCFMDMETYEQVEIPAERLEWESKFLLEGMNIEIVFYGDEILGVNLPEKVSLEVTEASPAVAGNTATNALVIYDICPKNTLLPKLYTIAHPILLSNNKGII